MTNQEVIRVLQAIKEHPSMGVYLPDEYEALDVAIKALKNERPHGKWIRITNSTAPTQMWNCSVCGRTVEKNTVLDPDIFFPFCHCGADMRKEVDNDDRKVK